MSATSIKKSELKNIIKEMLLEMIKDGSLNEVFVAASPKIQAATANTNSTNKSMLELAFADTAMNELHKHQQAVDPNQMLHAFQQQQMNPNPMMNGMFPQNNMVNVPPLGMGMMQPQQPQNWNNQQQMMPQQGWNNQQQMMQPMPQQPQQGMNRWAALAFNSPIVNRPSKEGSPLLGAINEEGFLPGQGRGRFG